MGQHELGHTPGLLLWTFWPGVLSWECDGTKGGSMIWMESVVSGCEGTVTTRWRDTNGSE